MDFYEGTLNRLQFIAWVNSLFIHIYLKHLKFWTEEKSAHAHKEKKSKIEVKVVLIIII